MDPPAAYVRRRRACPHICHTQATPRSPATPPGRCCLSQPTMRTRLTESGGNRGTQCQRSWPGDSQGTSRLLAIGCRPVTRWLQVTNQKNAPSRDTHQVGVIDTTPGRCHHRSAMPSYSTPEDEFRALMSGDHPRLRRNRRLLARVPSDPRCKTCNAPFGFPGSVVSRAIGRPRFSESALLPDVLQLAHHGGDPRR